MGPDERCKICSDAFPSTMEGCIVTCQQCGRMTNDLKPARRLPTDRVAMLCPVCRRECHAWAMSANHDRAVCPCPECKYLRLPVA